MNRAVWEAKKGGGDVFAPDFENVASLKKAILRPYGAKEECQKRRKKKKKRRNARSSHPS